MNKREEKALEYLRFLAYEFSDEFGSLEDFRKRDEIQEFIKNFETYGTALTEALNEHQSKK
jgi:hypothetical protein